MSFDRCVHPCNHHCNQDKGYFISPKSPLIPLQTASPQVPAQAASQGSLSLRLSLPF